MSEIMLKYEEIDRIFKTHLKIESKVLSIDSLFANERLSSKIDYKPYFQRKYVWDKDKATYFIESILLGTEIPPLVFFNNFKKIEIIDGRQRYETIKNFIDKKFSLTNQGLMMLKHLSKKDFDDIDVDLQNMFWDTKLRILEFSVVNEPILTDKKEDLIKKEIFRRYNSGITPLKKAEIEKAIYIDDDLSTYFKKKIKSDLNLNKTLLKLFFSERDVELIEKNITIDKVMTKIRQLLVLHNIPIKRYSSLPNRNDMLAKFYDILTATVDDVEEFFEVFVRKIEINKNLNRILNSKNSVLGNNRLVYECTFWILTILQIELRDWEQKVSEKFLIEYADYLILNGEKFILQNSHFYKNVNERYDLVSEYFEVKLGLNLGIFVDDYSVFRGKLDNSDSGGDESSEIKLLEQIRLNKPEPTSWTIDDICRQMSRNKFLIRPPYQRDEVMNRIKSSALIESILLGIKLPPIFLYRREDGIHEVVDGQQRLLSILGFMGKEFVNEEGKRVKSEKNKFKLSELRIFSELKNKDYDELDQDLKDRILDFNISVVIIDAKLNPNFDSVDLFIRLNNKPYPIRENSFEMWNSYIDKDIISKIKENTNRHTSWFHIKTEQYNNRMDNEELYSTLAYLEYKRMSEPRQEIYQYLNVYQRVENINTRIKSKSDITKALNDATIIESEKEKFIQCINNVEYFIQKIKVILSGGDGGVEDDVLKNELNNLFYTKSTRRTTQSFYSLWLILDGVSLNAVNQNKDEIKKQIRGIFYNMKNAITDGNGLQDYFVILDAFKSQYSLY